MGNIKFPVLFSTIRVLIIGGQSYVIWPNQGEYPEARYGEVEIPNTSTPEQKLDFVRAIKSEEIVTNISSSLVEANSTATIEFEDKDAGVKIVKIEHPDFSIFQYIPGLSYINFANQAQ